MGKEVAWHSRRIGREMGWEDLYDIVRRGRWLWKWVCSIMEASLLW